MMGDVPLDAARHPSADEADERGFDDVLMIHEIVTVALVHGFEQSPADLRQHADAHEFVLEVNDAVGLVGFDVGERVVERIRINAAFGTLGIAAEIEHRVRLRIAGEVGGDGDVLLRNRNRGAGGRDKGDGSQGGSDQQRQCS